MEQTDVVMKDLVGAVVTEAISAPTDERRKVFAGQETDSD